MNATTQFESTALSLPERASVALGSPAHEVKLRELVKASAAILTVTNKAGREECHTAYMTLKNTRVNINHTVEEVTEGAKKFTKAVKAEAARLLTITLAEEDRLQKLRDEWDEAEQARKDALIQAERERVDKIRTTIDNIKAAPVRHVASDSAALAKAVEFYLIMPVEESEFEEFTDEVKQAIGATLEKLREMGIAAAGKEQAARDAEAARIAELERLEAARLENERVAAENARIAAEQKAEAQRLADIAKAQQDAILAAQKEADAKAQAARDEQARAAAAQQAIIDAQIAAMAEQKAALEAQQAAADARDAAALQKLQDEAKREADHGPALMMNAEFDVARDAEAEAERARLQGLAEQAVADKSLPGGQRYSTTTFKDNGEPILLNADGTRSVFCDLNDDIEDPDHVLTDAEIIEMIAAAFDMTRAEAIDRLQAIDFDAAREVAA